MHSDEPADVSPPRDLSGVLRKAFGPVILLSGAAVVVCVVLGDRIPGFVLGVAIANGLLWMVFYSVLYVVAGRGDASPGTRVGPVGIVLDAWDERRRARVVAELAARLDDADESARVTALMRLSAMGRENPDVRQAIVDAWCRFLGADHLGTGTGVAADPADGAGPGPETHVGIDVETLRRDEPRALALRLLVERLRLPETGEADTSWTSDLRRLRLRGAVLVDADLSHCALPVVDATCARFHGTTSFVGAVFRGEAAFGEAVFAGPVDFGGAEFARRAGFVGTRFGSDARFDEATFLGAVAFEATRFDAPGSFDGAAFHGVTRFTGLDSADTDRLTFHRTTVVLEPSTFETCAPRSHVWPQGWTPAPEIGADSLSGRAFLVPDAQGPRRRFDAFADLVRGTDPVSVGSAVPRLRELGDRHPVLRQDIVDELCAVLRRPVSDFGGDVGPRRAASAVLGAILLSSDAADGPSWSAELWRLDLSGVLVENLSLSNCVLPDVDFSGARFVDEILFDDTVFNAGADFKDARFDGAVGFSRVRAVGPVRFSGASFQDVASFPRARFESAVNLARAVFADATSFKDAFFGGDVVFTESAFDGPADFLGVTCDRRAMFDGADFADDVRFVGSTFARESRFEAASFHGGARFSDARFAGVVTFDETVFHGDAAFDGAAFSDDAGFRSVGFEGSVQFDRATVLKALDLSEARFLGSASFEALDLGPDAVVPLEPAVAARRTADADPRGDTESTEMSIMESFATGDMSRAPVPEEAPPPSTDPPAESSNRDAREREAYEAAVRRFRDAPDSDRGGAANGLHTIGCDRPELRQEIVDLWCGLLRSGTHDGTVLELLETVLVTPAVAAARDAFDRYPTWTPDLRKVDLAGVVFPDSSPFKACVFPDVDFSGARFGGEAVFSDALFTGSADFSGAIFAGVSRFGGARFEGEAGFARARFERTVVFWEASFVGATRFDDVTFRGDVEFDGARFDGAFVFDRASIHGVADFSDVRFDAAASFVDVELGSDATIDFARADVVAPTPGTDAQAVEHVWPGGWNLMPCSGDDHGRGRVVPDGFSGGPDAREPITDVARLSSLLDHRDADVRMRTVAALREAGDLRPDLRQEIVDAVAAFLRRTTIQRGYDRTESGVDWTMVVHDDARAAAQRLLCEVLPSCSPSDDPPSWGAEVRRVDLSGAGLVDVDLRGRDLPRMELKKAEFKGRTRFDRSCFNGVASFASVRFTGVVEFTGAVFRDRADFSESRFKGPADFSNVVFHEESSFAIASFDLGARFVETGFRRSVDFGDVVFDGDAVLHRAWFGGVAVFEGMSLDDGVTLCLKGSRAVLELGDPADPQIGTGHVWPGTCLLIPSLDDLPEGHSPWGRIAVDVDGVLVPPDASDFAMMEDFDGAPYGTVIGAVAACDPSDMDHGAADDPRAVPVPRTAVAEFERLSAMFSAGTEDEAPNLSRMLMDLGCHHRGLRQDIVDLWCRSIREGRHDFSLYDLELVLRTPGHDHARRVPSWSRDLRRLDLSGAHIDGLVLIGRSLPHTDFRGARFTGRTWIEQAVFDGDVDFTGAVFGSDVFVRDVEFKGRARLDGIRFDGTPFVNRLRFQNATFTGAASFVDIDALGYFSFDGAMFAGPFRFDGGPFRGNLHFRETGFGDSVSIVRRNASWLDFVDSWITRSAGTMHDEPAAATVALPPGWTFMPGDNDRSMIHQKAMPHFEDYDRAAALLDHDDASLHRDAVAALYSVGCARPGRRRHVVRRLADYLSTQDVDPTMAEARAAALAVVVDVLRPLHATKTVDPGRRADSVWIGDVDEIELRDTRIDGADFGDCVLPAVRFQSVRFTGGAGFDAATFTGPTSFVDCDFHGTARFTDVVAQEVHFARNRFHDPVLFDRMTLHGGATFDGGRFDDVASFRDLGDRGAISFSGTWTVENPRGGGLDPDVEAPSGHVWPTGWCFEPSPEKIHEGFGTIVPVTTGPKRDPFVDALTAFVEGGPAERSNAVGALHELGERDPDLRQRIVDAWCDHLRDATAPDDEHEYTAPSIDVRTVVQAYLASVLRPSPSLRRTDRTSWSDDLLAVDLSEARLVDADWSDCRFPEVDFTGARFDGDVSFASAAFTSAVSFDAAAFEGFARFSAATFDGPAFFDGVRFEAAVVFDRAVFHDDVDFDDARFGDTALFGDVTTTVGSAVTFDGARAVLRPIGGGIEDGGPEHRWPLGWRLTPSMKDGEESRWGRLSSTVRRAVVGIDHGIAKELRDAARALDADEDTRKMDGLRELERIGCAVPKARQAIVNTLSEHLRRTMVPSEEDDGDDAPGTFVIRHTFVRRRVQDILITHFRRRPIGRNGEATRPELLWTDDVDFVDLSGVVLIDADFADCVLPDIDLSKAGLANVRFTGTDFAGSADFREAGLLQTVKFINVTFTGPAWFERAKFNDDITFQEATFQRTAAFDGAEIPGRVIMLSARFGDAVSFQDLAIGEEGYLGLGDVSAVLIPPDEPRLPHMLPPGWRLEPFPSGEGEPGWGALRRT